MCAQDVRVWCVVTVLAVVGLNASVVHAEVSPKRVRAAADRSLQYLSSVQDASGAFSSVMCDDAELTRCQRDAATLPTIAILMGLVALNDAKASPLIQRGADFLRREMDGYGFLRYTATGHPQHEKALPTFELTCMARLVLEPLGVSMPPVLRHLVAYELPGGVYYPFALPVTRIAAVMMDPQTRANFAERYREVQAEMLSLIDPTVNAWIFNYYVAHGESPAGLCESLVRMSRSSALHDNGVYVQAVPMFPYALALASNHGAQCLEPAKALWQQRLLASQRADGGWGGALDTALSVSALARFGVRGAPLDRAVERLLTQQAPDGSWPLESWWRLHEPPVWFAGTSVTTSYALEALGLWLAVQELAKGQDSAGGRVSE